MVRFPLAAANVLSSESIVQNKFKCLALLLTANGCRGTSREQILKLVEVKSLGLKEMNVEVQQFIRAVVHILSITNAHDSKRMVV